MPPVSTATNNATGAIFQAAAIPQRFTIPPPVAIAEARAMLLAETISRTGVTWPARGARSGQ